MLVGDMAERLDGRSEFTHLNRYRFESSDKITASHGFGSWRAISKIDAETGKFLRGDLRKEGRTAIKLSPVNEICEHFDQENPPDENRNEKKGRKIEGVSTPTRMRGGMLPLVP